MIILYVKCHNMHMYTPTQTKVCFHESLLLQTSWSVSRAMEAQINIEIPYLTRQSHAFVQWSLFFFFFFFFFPFLLPCTWIWWWEKNMCTKKMAYPPDPCLHSLISIQNKIHSFINNMRRLWIQKYGLIW